MNLYSPPPQYSSTSTPPHPPPPSTPLFCPNSTPHPKCPSISKSNLSFHSIHLLSPSPIPFYYQSNPRIHPPNRNLPHPTFNFSFHSASFLTFLCFSMHFHHISISFTPFNLFLVSLGNIINPPFTLLCFLLSF